MSNIPTVTDKTTLSPSPTTHPTDSSDEPISPDSSLYPQLSTVNLRLSEQPSETLLNPLDSSETDSTGSVASIDSTNQPFLEFSTLGITNKEAVNLRKAFLENWDESVAIEKEYLEKSEKAKTRQSGPDFEKFKTQRAETHNKTFNSLNQYAFAVIRDKLEPDAAKTESAAKETTVKYVTELKDYIISKGGNDQLITF